VHHLATGARDGERVDAGRWGSGWRRARRRGPSGCHSFVRQLELREIGFRRDRPHGNGLQRQACGLRRQAECVPSGALGGLAREPVSVPESRGPWLHQLPRNPWLAIRFNLERAAGLSTAPDAWSR
jgi:hypothetical protein